MKKLRKQNLARLLAFIMLFVTVFQTVPVNAYAASGEGSVLTEAGGQDKLSDQGNTAQNSASGGDPQTPGEGPDGQPGTQIPGENTDGQSGAQTPGENPGGQPGTQTPGIQPQPATVSGNYSNSGNGVWQMKAAPTHGNNHPNASSGRAFFAVCDEDTKVTSQDFSATITSMTDKGVAGNCARAGYLVKYVADDNFTFIGWDAGGWYIQVAGDYQPLSGITAPDKGDRFTISGQWLENGSLRFSVENHTKQTGAQSAEVTQESVITKLAALKDVEGRFGLRVSGAPQTEILVENVTYADLGLYGGSWNSLYEAQEGQILQPYVKPSAEPKLWHIKASDQFGNGELDGSDPALFAADMESAIQAEDFQAVFMPVQEASKMRMGFLNKYVDNNNWSYIGYNPDGWYIQWKGEGTNWHNISKADIPLPDPYDMVTVDGSWVTDGLELTVTIAGVSGENSYTVTVTDAPFVQYKDMAGHIGFRAAGWGADYTEFYVKSVSIGATPWAGSLTPLVDIKDGIVETVDALPARPVTGEGKKWFYVKRGPKNGGGHGYMDPAAGPITLVDWDEAMPKDGKLTLRFKPETGNANFGIFYTIKDNDNWLYVGYDSSSHWYYQYNFNGSGAYSGLGGLPDPEAGVPMNISITVSQETLMVTVNGVTSNKPVDKFKELMESVDGQGRFGVMTKADPVLFTDVKLGTKDCMSDNWNFLVDREGQTLDYRFTSLVNVSGKVTDKDTGDVLKGATVRIGELSTVTGENGEYLIENVEEGNHKTAASMKDYVSTSGELAIAHDEKERTGVDFALASKNSIDLNKYKLIESDQMKAYVGKNFPLVLRYLDKTGKTIFVGQENEINQVKINGTLVTPVVTVNTDLSQEGISAVDYTLAVKEEGASLDLEMDVRISVEDRNLTWQVTRLEKKEGCAKLAAIEVPQLNLVTINSYGTDAEFMGAKVSTDTNASSDQRITFENGGGFSPNDESGYLYAFVSQDGYSAGLFSNSEAEGDLRVIRTNGAGEMSLTSAPWYYELGDAGGQAYATASQGYRVSELPVAKVSLADDLNGDKVVNWQDGAIAYRSIMHNAMGTDQIKDIVNYRIAMNFASMAPNPFLETADNIKKVFLATDGLPQAVMLKGYGNEGHDSANSEYADIAERQGGVDDFRKLIEIAHDYNTEIGIHVNAQEAYPEAASFSDTMVGKNTTGIGNGWGWLDQSHAIDKLWDLQSQARYKRFIQLYDRINGTSFYSRKWDVDNKLNGAVGESAGEILATMEEIRRDAMNRPNNMDFIYLDVWYQNSWETRRVAEEINSLGWRFSTEFSAQGEYDSTWQHWSTDAAYGGSVAKGFNSDVIRFIRNDQRDSQVLNYPAFGGTADNPLLGGYRLRGFEGWGGDNSFSDYIYYTFKDNLPTRFLQHYQVTNWENYGEGEAPTGNHEKAITLKNDKGDVVYVSRVEAQRDDEEIEREITLNGRRVLYCAPEEFSYLLPWTDDQDGSEKLYHWNMYDTQTSWKLPDGWDGVSAVHVYKLTDQGRTDGQTVAVVNGELTLKAEAGVPYVITKAEGEKALKNYYGEGGYVADPGFNGYADGEKLNGNYWSGDLDAFTVFAGDRNDQFVQADSPDKTVSVSTTISGLTPGRNYVAEIYVDNRSDAKAVLELENGGETLSNYTLRSIAANYVQCDEQHTRGGNESYMQEIQIPFTAKGEAARFTLKREAGEGLTMWDDIRIVEKKLDNYKEDGSFEQDFESVVQGIYPFVLSYAQGVTDPTTHLSELHAPYTQTGWNGRVIDDVIAGNWSLKNHTNGVSGVIYQTIPQNFRFEPGKVYQVSFDYQAGASGAYAMITGEGVEFAAPDTYLASSVGEDGNKTVSVTMTVVGAQSGQTWIGLYCNGQNGSGVMGQRDFVLDNLKITEDKDTLVIYGMEGKTSLLVGEGVQLNATNSANAAWTSDNEKVITVDADGYVKAVGKGSATVTVKNESGKSAEVTFTVDDGRTEEVTPAAAEANTFQPESGIAENAIDGDLTTVWHSAWSGYDVGPDQQAVITVDFGKEVELAGFYYINRPSGTNGIIQKYQWIAGNSYDEESKTITDGVLSSELAPENQAAGGREEVLFDGVQRLRYLQIVVSEGVGKFASVAELGGLSKVFVASGVKLDRASAEMTEGDTITLKAAATEGEILVSPAWYSSDPLVASVDENGQVKALKEGTAVITFTTGNGLKAECSITVSKKNQGDVEPDEVKPEDAIADLAGQLEQIDPNAPLSEKKAAVQQMLDKAWSSGLTGMEINEATLESLERAENAVSRLLGTGTQFSEGSMSGFGIKYALLSVPAGSSATIRIIPVNDIPPVELPEGKELAGASAFDVKLLVNDMVQQLLAPVILNIPVPEDVDVSKPLIVLHYADGSDVGDPITPLSVGDKYIDVIAGSFSTFVVANVTDAGGNNGSGGNDNNGGSGGGGNGDENNGSSGGNGGNGDENNGGSGGNGGNGDDNNGGSNDNNGSDSGKQPASGTDRRSPKTYDNSVFTPEAGGADSVNKENVQDGVQAAAVTGAAAREGILVWVIVAAAAVLMVIASIYQYRKKK